MNSVFDKLSLEESFDIMCSFMRSKLDHEFEVSYSEETSNFIRAAFIEDTMKQFLESKFQTYFNMPESERNSKSERLSLRFK